MAFYFSMLSVPSVVIFIDQHKYSRLACFHSLSNGFSDCAARAAKSTFSDTKSDILLTPTLSQREREHLCGRLWHISKFYLPQQLHFSAPLSLSPFVPQPLSPLPPHQGAIFCNSRTSGSGAVPNQISKTVLMVNTRAPEKTTGRGVRSTGTEVLNMVTTTRR